MSQPHDPELKKLFGDGYLPSPDSTSMVDSVMKGHRRRTHRNRIFTFIAVAVTVAAGLFGSSSFSGDSPKVNSTPWVTELDRLYDEYDDYTADLLEESEQLDELTAETYAYFQLMESQQEE